MSYDFVEQFLERRGACHSNPQGDLAVGTTAGKSLLTGEVMLPGIGTVATPVDVSKLRAAERAAEARALELQRLARTDSLTNLANRRYFFEVVDGECERAD